MIIFILEKAPRHGNALVLGNNGHLSQSCETVAVKPQADCNTVDFEYALNLRTMEVYYEHSMFVFASCLCEGILPFPLWKMGICLFTLQVTT